MDEISNIIKVLQASVAPCLLISGFGFLLLTMTNRMARATDRIRELSQDTTHVHEEEAENHERQIAILYKRSRILQAAIAFLTFSIFFVGIDVLMLFTAITFELSLGLAIKLFFSLSIVSLIVSLSLFLVDISMTLESLKIEIGKEKT